ncbi:uncharacterized protein LOC123474319 [Daphnia magna]|uniref:uncharacterized protein LOC123474319 n=1 Tax=Daphnia magna TaxID=35525 RepID=UPI001E1BB839|nr:uncharacterized protein LOC123474319 [Daphnia magna]
MDTDPTTTACAVYSPTLNFENAWTLTAGTSVFSAELIAIAQALKHIYNLDDHPLEVMIFSDSSSAIKTIMSATQTNNEAVSDARETIASLKSSGTATSIVWIPSHTWIEGNEKADRLAATECTKQNGNKIANNLSAEEIISLTKANWRDDLLSTLRQCQKKCIQVRTRLGVIKWHQHNNRKISTCLHRLRAGHHYLNSFRYRIDQESDPSCRHGFEATENSQHLLLTCPKHENHRTRLRLFLSGNHLPFEEDTILGLNLAIDPRTQFKIRNLLANFLVQSGVINSI